jgi:hypothetical protein
MWATKGETRWGTPASDITDYEELRVSGFTKANNERSAGRTRIAELLKPQPDRYFPRWHPRCGEQGAPQFYVVGRNCPELVEQIATAPLLSLDAARKGAGEIVDPNWESRYGHAIAALRYGLMSRPSASEPSKRREFASTRDRITDEFWERQGVEDERQDTGFIDRSDYSI